MSLDKSAVRTIADLARIQVPDQDLDHLVGELTNILTFIEHLSEINTDGVQPMSSVSAVGLPMREDVVSDGGYADKVLANAADKAEGFFSVPKVVE